jgi:hypothetical protein
MRTIFCYVMLIMLTLVSCRKQRTELEKLPPATQTGAEIFGCLVNGEAFKPKGSPFGGPILSCAYQYINGGYYFQLSAKHRDDVLSAVSIHSDSLQIQEGKTYKLEDFFKKGNASGRYVTGMISSETEFLTTEVDKGELKITKLNETAHIVSGTFWFDAVNKVGQKVQVREGRFDLHYTL